MRLQRSFIVLLSLVFALMGVACKKDGTSLAEKSIVIACYDSFASEWGTGPAVIPIFEAKYGIKVRLESHGDAGQLLEEAIRLKAQLGADILLGYDNNQLTKIDAAKILINYRAKGIADLRPELGFESTKTGIPFDFGYFGIIWDTKSPLVPPHSMDNLCEPQYASSLILMDPRSSSPGLGFLASIVALKGDAWTEYWQDLKPSILTISPGWDSGYGLFVKGEAPMVISYTTSPAYHLYAESSERYKALVFPEGHLMQVEYVGILKSSRKKAQAEAFMDFVLSQDFQGKIALTNWMYPAIHNIKLPDCYNTVPTVKKLNPPDEASVARALASWAKVAAK